MGSGRVMLVTLRPDWGNSTNKFDVGGGRQGTTRVNAKDKNDWRGLSFNVPNENISWLVGSYVGTTVNHAVVQHIQKYLTKEGLFNLVATPMGGDMVLLTAKDNFDVLSLLSEVGECLENVFSDIKPWEPHLVPRVRTVWLRVTRVPVHAWGEDFFRFISHLVGNFIYLDEDTSSKARLDVGRLLVTVSSLEVINRTVKVKVNDLVSSIRMVEEVFAVHPYNRSKSMELNSESGFTSDDSEFVEGTFLGDSEGIEEGFLRDDGVCQQEAPFSNSKTGVRRLL